MILHEINGCDPVIQYSQCPVAIMSACGLVGWMVKANFVLKIAIVGLVRIALLDGREPLFLHSGVHLVQTEISLVQ